MRNIRILPWQNAFTGKNSRSVSRKRVGLLHKRVSMLVALMLALELESKLAMACAADTVKLPQRSAHAAAAAAAACDSCCSCECSTCRRVESTG